MKGSLLSHKVDRMRENVMLQVKPDGSKSTSFSWSRAYILNDTISESDSKFTAKASFLHPGFNKCWIPETTFCTCSSYEGEWNGIGMYGVGEYYFPHSKLDHPHLIIYFEDHDRKCTFDWRLFLSTDRYHFFLTAVILLFSGFF